jgi:hypothetical protein
MLHFRRRRCLPSGRWHYDLVSALLASLATVALVGRVLARDEPRLELRWRRVVLAWGVTGLRLTKQARYNLVDSFEPRGTRLRRLTYRAAL